MCRIHRLVALQTIWFKTKNKKLDFLIFNIWFYLLIYLNACMFLVCTCFLTYMRVHTHIRLALVEKNSLFVFTCIHHPLVLTNNLCGPLPVFAMSYLLHLQPND